MQDKGFELVGSEMQETAEAGTSKRASGDLPVAGRTPTQDK